MLLLTGTMSLNLNAATVIGTASARGTFAIDHARVEQATVFEGSSIGAGPAAIEINLQSGTRVLLGAGSQGVVYHDRLVLGQGQTQFDTSLAFGVETAGLRVEAGARSSSARVSRHGETIQLAALRGSFSIRDLQGRVLANVNAGENLQLTSALSNSNAVSFAGRIREVDGKYLLTDETTKTTFELRGPSVQTAVGKRVKVAGTMAAGTPASGAPRVIEVTSIHAATGALSTTAIVGGVLIASGTGIALGVGLTRDDPKPTASR